MNKEHEGNGLKTALFVSRFYPPAMPVGSERVLKFRKYLPQFGYQTVVLATRVLGKLTACKAGRTRTEQDFANHIRLWDHWFALHIPADLIIITDGGTQGDRILHQLGADNYSVVKVPGS